MHKTESKISYLFTILSHIWWHESSLKPYSATATFLSNPHHSLPRPHTVNSLARLNWSRSTWTLLPLLPDHYCRLYRTVNSRPWRWRGLTIWSTGSLCKNRPLIGYRLFLDRLSGSHRGLGHRRCLIWWGSSLISLTPNSLSRYPPHVAGLALLSSTTTTTLTVLLLLLGLFFLVVMLVIILFIRGF